MRQGKLYWTPLNDSKDRAEGIEDPYNLLDARISLAPANENWGVSIWGKNLANKDYRNHVIAFLGEEVSFFAPPRTYGVELTYNF